ncbi:MAG: hypothetical protein V1740_00565 [Candidatus Woesearchaeota archaeon]
MAVIVPGPLCIFAKLSRWFLYLILLSFLLMLILFLIKDHMVEGIFKRDEKSKKEPEKERKGDDPKKKEEETPRNVEHLKERLKLLLTSYESLIVIYRRKTEELIIKTRETLSVDSSYYGSRPVDFDMGEYNDIIRRLSDLEERIINLIDSINGTSGWEGTEYERIIKIYIQNYEELYVERRSITRKLEEELPDMS